MDTTLIVTGGLISLAAHSINCLGRRRAKQAKKMHLTKLSSLIISKGSGKTQLYTNLNSLTSDLIIVDLNTVIVKESMDELEYLQAGRIYVNNLLKNFPKKRFLLLLSTKQESEYFNVAECHTFVVCPSIKLFSEILGDIPPTELQKRLLMESERLKLIKDTLSDNLNVFASFSDLYTVVKQQYRLQSTF